MGDIYENIKKGLLEAIEMEKGYEPVESVNDMPAPTYKVFEEEKKLISELIDIRKSKGVPQSEIAEKTGCRQQAISRLEKMEHSPSLKLFVCMAGILGYDVCLVKKH